MMNFLTIDLIKGNNNRYLGIFVCVVCVWVDICVCNYISRYNKANLFIILGRMFASTINTFLYLLLLLHDAYTLVEGLVTIYLGLRISGKSFCSIKH